MSASPMRVALIGAGGYGRIHLEMIRLLERENLVELVAVADPILHDASALTAGLRAQNIRCYENYLHLLEEEPRLEAVSIAAPIPLHEQMVREALARGLRVYLEKPPVPTIQQLRELIELDPRGRVTVGFQMAKFPQVQQLKEWIVTGALGEVLQITATACWPRPTSYYRRADWAGRLLLEGVPVLDGPPSNGLAHLVQMIMFICGAKGSACAVPEWVQGEFYRVRPIESYDLAAIAGGFADGAKFTMLLAHCGATKAPFSITVKGSRGSAWIGHDGAEIGNDCGLAGAIPCGISTLSGIDFYREAFRRMRAGDTPLTSLRDCLGYAKTVCGGLISSGGIHPVKREYASTVGVSGDLLYDLKGLTNLLENVRLLGKLPSQQNLPWAVAGRCIQTSEVEEIDLLQYLPEKPVVEAVG
jgi:predicted dehydrogenase